MTHALSCRSQRQGQGCRRTGRTRRTGREGQGCCCDSGTSSRRSTRVATDPASRTGDRGHGWYSSAPHPSHVYIRVGHLTHLLVCPLATAGPTDWSFWILRGHLLAGAYPKRLHLVADLLKAGASRQCCRAVGNVGTPQLIAPRRHNDIRLPDDERGAGKARPTVH